MADEDTELTTLSAVVALLLNAKLDDAQRRRIIQYANSRCIKPEPQWTQAQAGLLNQSQYKGIG